MLQTIAAATVVAIVLSVAVLSVMWACQAPSTPLEAIQAWASAQQLKLIELEQVSRWS